MGVPSATVGLQAEDPAIAQLLKPLGYATGQFGKNHLGDRNEYLPTVHGFDEFYGNLYHVNAEKEPELPNWPPAADFPHFRERFGPRGVLNCWATDADDPSDDPRWGRDEDRAGLGHDPFRSEKNTNWEGAFRVPELVRWPGHIPTCVVSNWIIHHHDWLPTFLAAAGEPDIVEKLKQGHTAGDKTFQVYIGYDLLPYLTGQVDRSPRPGMVYLSDDGTCCLALRQLEGRLHGAADAGNPPNLG